MLSVHSRNEIREGSTRVGAITGALNSLTNCGWPTSEVYQTLLRFTKAKRRGLIRRHKTTITEPTSAKQLVYKEKEMK